MFVSVSRSWHRQAQVGILYGMTMTTIKVPKVLRDRLHQLAVEDGLTLAQEIERLMERNAPRPKPSVGGFRSGSRWSAVDADEELLKGFGE